jgi:hypothetical protein
VHGFSLFWSIMTFRAGFMVLNVVVVYRMEHAQTGEGEVPQDFIFWCFH